MTFYDVLAQVLDLLQRQKRVSYRALKRQFNLDDEYLEDLKAEIIDAQRLATDEDGRVLVWSGAATAPAAIQEAAIPSGRQKDQPASIAPEDHAHRALYAALPAGKVAGAAGGDEPESAVAGPRQVPRSPTTAG